MQVMDEVTQLLPSLHRDHPIHSNTGPVSRTNPVSHPMAELDRDWVWISGDLRGDHNLVIREAIKAIGFVFGFKDHVLPSGRTARWAHHCEHPIPRFKPGSSKKKQAPSANVEALARELGLDPRDLDGCLN